jgi:predicted amidophosphoribosyltransferase
MPQMYCPQCGRELALDSGEISFCRYCGFSLVDTKEALHGYSQQKRTGFSIVTLSYTLLLMVTLLLHGQYVSLQYGLGLLAINHAHRPERQLLRLRCYKRIEAAHVREGYASRQSET